MSFEGLARAGVRFTREFVARPQVRLALPIRRALTLLAALSVGTLAPHALYAQASPPSALNPLPGKLQPGPQPARPPIQAPLAPVLPQPTGVGADSAAAPPAFPEGAPAPAFEPNALPDPELPPHEATQPLQPYYGESPSLPGTPQPTWYQQRPLSRPSGPGSNEHEGFFLRFTAGGGAAGMSYRERFSTSHVSDVRTRGLAGSIDVSLGGVVAERLIVHGTASFTAVRARRSIDGVHDDSYESIGTKFWLLGAGVSYYVVPPNFYVTLVLGTGGMVEQRDYGTVGVQDQALHTNAGFAMQFSVGKEWWVGGRGEWGIGGVLTGGFYAAPIDIGSVHSVATGNSITLGFSATLN